jgi:uncharacterized membrane protein YoaK (UPF0700 family)
MPLPLPILLAVVAGAVDTTSFLSLSGLFAAHITGNFVVLGATLVLGQPRGVWSKLAALPVFVLGVWLASLAVDRFHPRDPRRPLLTAELVLVLGALAVTVARGPFADADHPWGFAAGMLLVAAMAIQNAFGPLAAPGAPPTAVMTGNMTRLFVDLALLLARTAPHRQARHTAQRQARELSWQGAGFLLGCAAAALSHVVLRNWALAVPAVCLALALLLPRPTAALTPRAAPRS